MRIPFWIAPPRPVALRPVPAAPRRPVRVTAAVLSRVGPLLRGTAPAVARAAAGGRQEAGGTRAGAGRAPGTGSSGWSWRAGTALRPPAPRISRPGSARDRPRPAGADGPSPAAPPRPSPSPRRERSRPPSAKVTADGYDVPEPVPIPADVELPDKVLAGLTARQVAIAAVAAVIIWAGFQATRHVMPLPAFAALAAPVGLAAAALVIGERDGLPLDRLLLAAWRQRARPAPPGHRPRGHPRPARLGRPRPARRPRPRRVLRAAVAAHRARRGDRPGQRRGRRGRGGVDGQLRAAQPGRAGRAGRRLRPVAELA